MYIRFSAIFFILFFLGCDYRVNTTLVDGVAGNSGQQTKVERNTQGNMFGYYEYLPLEFAPELNKLYPIVFYWNGLNAISGNGRDELPGVLRQGLPEYIKQGKHFPAIIISGQMKYNDWKSIDVHPFVKYILKRYSKFVDLERVYMTGFSAGGGLTIRYTIENPNILAAIVPVSPAARINKFNEPDKLKNTHSWFFHNKGDLTIDFNNSVDWYNLIKNGGAEHKITIYDVDGHYAWNQAYSDIDMWNWLLSKTRETSIK